MTTEQQHLATDTAESEPLLPPAPPAPLVIPRGVQLVLLLVGLLGLWVAGPAARSVVEIVVVASFIALILNPFVSLPEPPRLPRGLAIPLTYLLLLLALGGDRRGACPTDLQPDQRLPAQRPPPCRRGEQAARQRADGSSTATASTSSSRSRARQRSTRSRQGAEGLELAALVHHEPA